MLLRGAADEIKQRAKSKWEQITTALPSKTKCRIYSKLQRAISSQALTLLNRLRIVIDVLGGFEDMLVERQAHG